MGTATAMTDCSVLRIEKKAIMQALHPERTLSDMFVAYLLARNVRYEEDLVDQLFNSSRKTAGPRPFNAGSFWQRGGAGDVVPKVTQETWRMVGTTRSPVSSFMDWFREMGFIDYSGGEKGGLHVHGSLPFLIDHLKITLPEFQSPSIFHSRLSQPSQRQPALRITHTKKQ